MCSFRVAVERHLKSWARLPVRLFFSGMFFVSCLRVRECRRRGGPFWKKNDFTATCIYFPLGIRVFYQMRLKTFISWSPKNYDLCRDGVSALLPRAYHENISFNFTKIALQDSE